MFKRLLAILKDGYLIFTGILKINLSFFVDRRLLKYAQGGQK
jgi:hypothetical protein